LIGPRPFGTDRTLAGKSKLLWVSGLEVPANVRRSLERDWQLTPVRPDQPLAKQLASASVALVGPNGRGDDPQQFASLLDELDRTSAVVVFLLPAESKATWQLLAGRRGQFLCVRQDAPSEELTATLAAAKAIQPVLYNLQSKLSASRALETNAGAFKELDEQMRLAAKLQRDFLPRRLPEVGPVRFGVLYHPASWVSGDIYDVARLDETNIGFYVADAVGHGMPAALLTIFIKKSLPTKRIVGSSYEIVPPHAALMELNADIYQQNLSSCQFCTAVYCILDVSSLTLTYARAGHPEPVLISPDGTVRKLPAAGSLLGVFPNEKFQSRQVRLQRGDRLVLYTDGAEAALKNSPEGVTRELPDALAEWAAVPREEMLLKLAAAIDAGANEAGSYDDATILVADVEK